MVKPACSPYLDRPVRSIEEALRDMAARQAAQRPAEKPKQQ
jgi:hypothetical protein